MSEAANPVWITGIGLLTALGEGNDAHWQAVNAAKPCNVDSERFAPYPAHTLGEVDWSQQISRRDMRQMEPWQQIGTYAAGLALDDAGVKDDEDLCGRMDMIVAAGGGERDLEVDSTVMAEARGKNDKDALLAERLSNDLRPTLFLAQLSNLMAGNISIVHKVTGSSRTFMGEEGAGISAVQTAAARIASGQSDIVLVGGAFNGEREDMLLLFELGHYLLRGDMKSVWERLEGSSGFAAGSMGAFLVLESKAHAQARGAEPYARIGAVAADHGSRSGGAAKGRLEAAIASTSAPDDVAILSGASGVSEITAEEKEVLDARFPGNPVRAYGTLFGHGIEAQFPLGIALAALAIRNQGFYPPLDSHEQPANNNPDNILVTTVGHWRSEGVGLVSRV